MRAHSFLLLTTFLSTGCPSTPPHRAEPPTRAQAAPLRVAIYDGYGAGAWAPLGNWIEALEGADATPVRPEEIRAGVLAGFDVVVFPGGMASHQFHALGADGRDQVRGFVADGGGYLGICAGAFLAAAAPYEWGMGLVDARVVDHEHWNRGVGDVQVELSSEGQRVLHDGAGPHLYRYANGPILEPANVPELPDYRALATFRSGVGENGADPTTMLGTPAILTAEYGGGRVLLSSGHAEWTAGVEHWLRRYVEWLGRSGD
jgi:hypothetical protein